MRSLSVPSLEVAMYFSVLRIISTTHVFPLQLIPSLFDVTIGVPVVSVTVTFTRVPSQTGMRLSFSPSELGFTMLPRIMFRIFRLLDGL